MTDIIQTTAFCVLCEQLKPKEGRPIPPQTRTLRRPFTAEVTCPRCGEYETDTALTDDNRKGLPVEIGLALSGLARTQTNAHGRLTVDSRNYEDLARSVRMPVDTASRTDSVLSEVAKRSHYPGSPTPQTAQTELAALAYLPDDAFAAFVRFLRDDGFLVIQNADSLRLQLQLTAKGWARVDELQAHPRHSKRAFVAMWFTAKMDAVYEAGIEPALVDCGYEPPFLVSDLRHQADIGKKDFKSKIDDRIMAGIRRARFVVVDVTGARPAVYFEAGFADGLGVEVIWCCEAAKKKDMCFDTRQFEHILWKDAEDLRKQLTAKIRARGWDVSTQNGGG